MGSLNKSSTAINSFISYTFNFSLILTLNRFSAYPKIAFFYSSVKFGLLVTNNLNLSNFLFISFSNEAILSINVFILNFILILSSTNLLIFSESFLLKTAYYSDYYLSLAFFSSNYLSSNFFFSIVTFYN